MAGKNHSNGAGARVQGAGARDLGGGEGQRRSLFFSFSTYLQSSFCAQLNSVSQGPFFLDGGEDKGGRVYFVESF